MAALGMVRRRAAAPAVLVVCLALFLPLGAIAQDATPIPPAAVTDSPVSTNEPVDGSAPPSVGEHAPDTPEIESEAEPGDPAPETAAVPIDTAFVSATGAVSLLPGEATTVTLAYHVTTPRAGTALAIDLRTSDGLPSDGWTVAAQAGTGEWIGGSTSVELVESTMLVPDATIVIDVAITAPAAPPIAESVTLHLGSAVLSDTEGLLTAIADTGPLVTLDVAPAPAVDPAAEGGEDAPDATAADRKSGDDTTMAPMAVTTGDFCTQASPGDDILLTGEYIVFRCDNPLNDEFYLRMTGITSGWAYSAIGSINQPTVDPPYTGNTWLTSNKVINGGNNITRAWVALRPNPTSTTFGPGSVQIEFVYGADSATPGKSHTPPSVAHLSATYSDTAPAAPCEPVVTAEAVAFGTSIRTEGAYASVTETVSLAISRAGAEGCTGLPDDWSIQISANAMDGPGDAIIPPEAIAYTGSASSPPTGLTPVSGPVSLATTPQTIATGDAEVPDGAWAIDLTITPPPTAPPGNYEGTLTIDIGTASD